jgi:hypothetical protein
VIQFVPESLSFSPASTNGIEHQGTALTQEEAQSGNVVGAENYYQHAEHYFRLMSSNRQVT